MESIVLRALLPTLIEDELDYSNTTDKDLSKLTGIDMKQMRGVLGSLSKKGIIICDTTAIDDRNYFQKMRGKKPLSYNSFVHLAEDFFYLHPSHE